MKRDTLGTLRARIAELEAGSPSIFDRSEVDTGKSGAGLTDAEVICNFMEPHKTALHGGGRSLGGWWVRAVLHVGVDAYEHTTGPWKPRIITLNECHEVEGRLSIPQVQEYNRSLWDARRTYVWHMSADAKVRALAAILRSRVLPKDDAEGTQAIQEKRG